MGKAASDAHIKASLMGPSLFVIVEDGEPRLGTWQSVYLYEGDGPRSRSTWAPMAARDRDMPDWAVPGGLCSGDFRMVPAAGVQLRRRGRLLARFFWESFPECGSSCLSALRRTLLRRPCPVRSVSS